MTFIREHASGATVADGLFVRQNDTEAMDDYLAGIQSYADGSYSAWFIFC